MFYVWNFLQLVQMILLNLWRRVLLLLWSRAAHLWRSTWTHRPGCRLILLGSKAIGWTFFSYSGFHLRFHGILHFHYRKVDSISSTSSIKLNIHHAFPSSFHSVSKMGVSLHLTMFSTSQMLWLGSDLFHYSRLILSGMLRLFSMISWRGRMRRLELALLVVLAELLAQRTSARFEMARTLAEFVNCVIVGPKAMLRMAPRYCLPGM